MRQIIVHKRFVKQFRKLPENVQRAFQTRRDIFLEDEHSSTLHVHSLQGKYLGYKSFNVTADIRVVYKELNENTILFAEIGSHSELYS